MKRPFAFTIARNIIERFTQPANDFDALWKHEPDFRHAWEVSTAVWGAGMLVSALLLVYMAYALPVDKVPLLTSLLHGGTFLILQIITNEYLERLGIWKLVFDNDVRKHSEQ